MPYIELDREWIGQDDDDEDDPENWKIIKLLAKWEVCPECEGEGTNRSAHLGAFTREELYEQGEEFVHDYFAGHYDRSCEECGGLRVVLVPDEERADPELLKRWQEQQDEEAYTQQLYRMESAYMRDY